MSESDLAEMNLEIAICDLKDAMNKLADSIKELRQWYENNKEALNG